MTKMRELSLSDAIVFTTTTLHAWENGPNIRLPAHFVELTSQIIDYFCTYPDLLFDINFLQWNKKQLIIPISGSDKNF